MYKIFLFLFFFPQQSPCAWTFTSKKIDANTYEIHCTATISGYWHTYSQFTPDGGPVPTKFTYGKNPLYTLDGNTAEKGSMITKHESVFNADVKYFEGEVDFVQRVKLKTKAKTNFTGSVEYMVCNDSQCLPPTNQKFTLALN
jgi:Disulphide bond corrector protein DsbC